MQDAMQLMFGPDGTPMHLPAPTTAQQDQQQQELEGTPSNKPALMQRLSVLARGPADSPSLRPFNMLAAPCPPAPASFLQSASPYLSQATDEASGGAPAQYNPPGEVPSAGGFPPSSAYTDMGDVTNLSHQPRLSMTGVVRDASMTQEPWLRSEPPPTPPAAKKGQKHSAAVGARQKKGKAGQLHVISEASSAVEEQQGGGQDVQPEFSFSPLGDIRKSLFGPAARGSSPSDDVNHVKVLFWDLLLLQAAQGISRFLEVVGGVLLV